ncbi:unnamed protein product [Nezara viridula]|uniref:Neuropeptide n=1 Tax=Nezara viridula TaxID=85310 RepID=A0A9P0H2D9_NEZVI|nr:unnamed protein product [Nezara viridula]
MVTGTIALALVIVGFVSCGSKQTAYDNSLKSDLPDSLPRPPDELTSSPQVELRNAVNSSSTTLPQQKMSNNSLTSSELELNLRYPYGDEDWNSLIHISTLTLAPPQASHFITIHRTNLNPSILTP